ncbi:MAG: hypothetical protein HY722_14605 [Planctomycetes bacterium]|nr:hypothetical protein [Planctomycetota bacterium]
MPPGPARALVPLALAAFVLVLHGPLLVGPGVPYQADFSATYVPIQTYFARTLAAGEFPLWNPHLLGGHPFFANWQAGLFYPVNYLFVWADPARALVAKGVFHALLGVLGMYALGRGWGLSRAAAALAAVAYGGSGAVALTVGGPPLTAAQAWSPWVLAAARAALDGGGRRAGAALAGLLGLALLGGYDNLAYLFLLLAAFALVEALAVRRRAGAILGGLAAAAAAGALVAAVQLVPLAELASHGTRTGGVSYAEASAGGLAPVGLSALWVPQLFGRVGDATLWGPGAPHRGAYLSAYLYFGLVALGLAVHGAWAGAWGRRERVLAGTFVVALLATMGPHTPVHRLLYECVPGFAYLRYPLKASLLVVLSGSLLAGVGLEALRRRPPDRRWAPAAAALAASAALVHAAARLGGPSLAEEGAQRLAGRYVALGHTAEAAWRYVEEAARVAAEGVALAAGLAAAALVVLALAALRRVPGGSAAAALVALAALDGWLFVARVPAVKTVEPGFYAADTPVHRLLEGEAGPFRVFSPEGHDLFELTTESNALVAATRTRRHEPDAGRFAAYLARLPQNHAVLYGLEDALGDEPLRLASWDSLCSLRRDSGAAIGRPATGGGSLDRATLGSAVFDLLNIRYLITGEEVRHPRWEQVLDTPVRVYRNRTVLPRAYGVRAVCEGLPRARPGEVGRVEVLGRGASEVRLAARMEAPGHVVLAEAWYPGWTATVDAREVPVRRSFGALRSVEVGAGAHEVVFRFRPRSLRVGLAGSVVGLLALGVATAARPRAGARASTRSAVAAREAVPC